MSDVNGNPVGAQRIELVQQFYADPSLPSWHNFDEFKERIDSEVAAVIAVHYESLPFKNDPLNQPFSLDEVKQQLKALVAGKAAGPDDIYPYMLKWAPDEFAEKLTAPAPSVAHKHDPQCVEGKSRETNPQKWQTTRPCKQLPPHLPDLGARKAAF